MNISVFGLGYVGCVSGVCLADMGHHVIGVDVNPQRVQLLNDGIAPIVEAGLPELLAKVTKNGDLTATTDWTRAVCLTDAALVCVGTPSSANGSLSLDVVTRVAEQIGCALRSKRSYFVVGIRSTVLPGTVEERIIPVLERCSGKKAGRDFGVCMIPEFMREGTSIHDFINPPQSLIGALDAQSGDTLEPLLRELDAPVIRTSLRVAEMVKYADNAFHALKVTFANEIGAVCKELECDSHQVMDIFCMDHKLNLSPYYLKPGFAFGGSCLPKDLRALAHRANQLDVETPLLRAILDSNEKQIAKVARALTVYKGRRLGFFGLSFKHGTDDLRESPVVSLIESMLGKGFDINIYDRQVSLARLVGSNKDFIEKEIPHIASLMCSTPIELLVASDVVVVSNESAEFRQALSRHLEDRHVVIDLVGVARGMNLNGRYHGLYW